jgi:hypothetical protein
MMIQTESAIRGIVRLALLSEGIGDPEEGASKEVGFAHLFSDTDATLDLRGGTSRDRASLLETEAVNHMGECVIRAIQFTMTDEELEQMEGARALLDRILNSDRTGMIIKPSSESGTYIVASTGRISQMIQSDTRLSSQEKAKKLTECLIDKMLIVMNLITGIIEVREEATLAQMKIDEDTRIEKAAREGKEIKRASESKMEEAAKNKVKEAAGPLLAARSRLSSVLDSTTSDYYAAMAYYGLVLNKAGVFEFVGDQPDAEQQVIASFDRMGMHKAVSTYVSFGSLIHPEYSGKSWHDIRSSKGTAIDEKELARNDKAFIEAIIKMFDRHLYSLGLGASRGLQQRGMPKPGTVLDPTLIINMVDEYNAAVSAARKAATGSSAGPSVAAILDRHNSKTDAENQRNAAEQKARGIGAAAAASREEARKAGKGRIESRPDVQSALSRIAAEQAAEEAQRQAGGLTAGATPNVRSLQGEVEEVLESGLANVASRLDGVGTGTLTGATPVERAHNAFIGPIARALTAGKWCDVGYLTTARGSTTGGRKLASAILATQPSTSPEASGFILEDILGLTRLDRKEERESYFSAGFPEEEQVVKGETPTRGAMRLSVTPGDIAAALKNVRRGPGGVSIADRMLNDRLTPYVRALGNAIFDARKRAGGSADEVNKIKAHFSRIGCSRVNKLVEELNDQIKDTRVAPSFTVEDPIQYLMNTPLEPVRDSDIRAAESQRVSSEEVRGSSLYRQAEEEFGASSEATSAAAEEMEQNIAASRRADLDRPRPVNLDTDEYEDPFGGRIYTGPQNEALSHLHRALLERAKKAARR